MSVTMVDLASHMFEIEEIPTLVNMGKKGSFNKVFDKKPIQISRLV